jgi:hypothetical protein
MVGASGPSPHAEAPGCARVAEDWGAVA